MANRDISIYAKVEGDREVLRNLEKVRDKIPQAMGRALYQEGEEIMTDSKTNYVPVKWGVLRATGSVDQPVVKGSVVLVTLGFGGPAAPYAIVQHERLDFKHNVGEAKYLEKPFLKALPGMGSRVAARVRRDVT